MSDVIVMDGARTEHGTKWKWIKAVGKQMLPINLTEEMSLDDTIREKEFMHLTQRLSSCCCIYQSN